MTLSDFARPILKWSGFALYAVALGVLALGVAGAFDYGPGLILDMLIPAVGAAIGGTALIGLSSLLSEISRLRAEIAAGASNETAPPARQNPPL